VFRRLSADDHNPLFSPILGLRQRVGPSRVLSFLFSCYAVRVAELLTNTSAEHTGAYSQPLGDILTSLTGGCELMPSISSWLI
jgi:hypothetical protein